MNVLSNSKEQTISVRNKQVLAQFSYVYEAPMTNLLLQLIKYETHRIVTPLFSSQSINQYGIAVECSHIGYQEDIFSLATYIL